MHLVLRLRGGGGGYEWKFINKRTGQETKISLDVSEANPKSALKKLALVQKLKPEDFKSVGNFKDDKVYKHDGGAYEYVTKLTYKDVAFRQSAIGLWTVKVLEFCDLKTVKDLAAANKDLKVTKSEVWYTLVGLKLLISEFDIEKPKWKLIANKARAQLKLNGFGSDTEIDKALEGLNAKLD